MSKIFDQSPEYRDFMISNLITWKKGVTKACNILSVGKVEEIDKACLIMRECQRKLDLILTGED